MAGQSRRGVPSAALVPVSGGRLAPGTTPALGPLRVGWRAPGRPSAARRGLSRKLDSVFPAPAQGLYPPWLSPVVFRDHPFHGGAFLLSVMPRPGAERRGFPAGRRGFRPGRLDGHHRLATNAEQRPLDSADLPVSAARHARPPDHCQRGFGGHFFGSGLPRRTSSDPHFREPGRRRLLDLSLLSERPTGLALVASHAGLRSVLFSSRSAPELAGLGSRK